MKQTITTNRDATRRPATAAIVVDLNTGDVGDYRSRPAPAKGLGAPMVDMSTELGRTVALDGYTYTTR